MKKYTPPLLDVALDICAEFSEAERIRGSRFRKEFRDPAMPGRVIQNAVGVRVKLLRQLQDAVKKTMRS